MNIFEITIQHQSSDCFPVVVEQTQPGNLPIRREGFLNFAQKDLNQFKDKLRELELNTRAYGELLGKVLFHEAVRDLFMQARSASEGDLRVLLVVEDRELKSLHWERLCAPIRLGGNWDFLARDQQILFSLYMPSLTDRRFPAIGRRDLRALVLIADPRDGNSYSLAPFDAEQTAAGIRSSLGEIPYDFLANIKDAAGSPTLDELCTRITGSHYTLLHITAHGWFNAKSGETILYLLDKNGDVAPVPADYFLERLDKLQGHRGLPHFVFLSTCDSCAPEAESAGAMGGLAQRMVRELGIPAVVAMTQKVSMTTADRLSGALYARLRDHGEVDRALVQACAEITDAADITVPALYSRLGGRPLFSDSEDRPLTDSEVEHGLLRMEELMLERAPVMMDQFLKQADILSKYLGTDKSSISEPALKEWLQALDAVNAVSEEVLDINFRAVALDQGIPSYDGRCPFPGLYAFQEKDREFFFGREPLVRLLLERLEKQNFLAILGPSGCGKSSVVLAGLIPEIQKQYPSVQICYMTPGDDPVSRLEKAAASNFGIQNLVIADQFEELFTLCPDMSRRREYIRRLLALHQNGLKIILTMRADFWGDCAMYSELKTVMQEHQELIAPMNNIELRNAMEQQASVVGLRFEADLSYTILSEVKDEPGTMPLLQHLLQELWKHRHGRWLRTEEYRSLGGIRQAIAHTADEIYRRFYDKEKEQMRNIFIRLTRLGEELSDTRRRVPINDLIPAGEDAKIIRNIVNRLADARLVITRPTENDTEVEVTHEALVRHWPRLRKWLDEDRHSLQILSNISEDSRIWYAGGRKDNLLPRWNLRIEEAVTLFRQPQFVQNQLERDYIKACKDLRDRETAQQAAYNARLKKRLMMAVIGIVIATFSGIFAFSQWQKAESKTQEAMHNLGFSLTEKAVREIERQNFNAGRLYALHALNRFDPKQNALEKAKAVGIVLSYPVYPIVFSSYLYPKNKYDVPEFLSFSPDCKTIGFGSGKTVYLWDVVTGKEKYTLSGPNSFQCIDFSPDSKILASGSFDKLIYLWDLTTGNLEGTFEGHKGIVNSVSFSPDGKMLASGSDDKTIRLWNLATKQEQALLNGHTSQVTKVFFAPDGKMLASASVDTIRIWDVMNKKEIKTLNGIQGISFSHDWKTIVSNSYDEKFRLWDFSGNEKVILTGHIKNISRMNLSSDGKILSTTDQANFPTFDNKIRLWDAQTGEEKVILKGHTGSAWAVKLSKDRRMLSAITNDQSIYIWDIKRIKENRILKGHKKGINDVKFSPNGQLIASASWDKTIRLWDLLTGKEIGVLEGHNNSINTIDFSPDGKTLASGSNDNTIRLWDVESGKEFEIFEGHKDAVASVCFSPNGLLLVSGAQDETIRLWDVKKGKEKSLLKRNMDHVYSVRFSPDGKFIASGGSDYMTRIWDIESRKELWVNKGKNDAAILDVCFSQNGRTLASASDYNIITLWDVETGKEKKILKSRTSFFSVNFSPEGDFLASGSIHGLIQLWNFKNGKEIARITGHTGAVRSVNISPDGKYLASGSLDATIRIWDLSFCYEVMKKRVSRETLKETERIYNLELENLQLKPVELEGNFFKIHPRPKWPKTHPFHWLSKAESGDAEAMVELGIIYDRDNELDKAVHWYTKAIEAGSERGRERMKVFKQWLTLHKDEFLKAYGKYCLNHD